MTTGRFQGRVALVTGGAGGIGRATCRRLADEGAAVAINYRSSQEAAEACQRQIQAAGGQAICVPGDVASADSVKMMVTAVVEQLGAIDILVNNAGIFEVVSHEETTEKTWRRAMDVNLTGTYLVTWQVKDQMIARGYGRIVNVASIAGLRPRPNSIAYAASKAGVISLTKSLSEPLAKHNVRVNAIAPGLIDTEMIADVAPQIKQELIDATPISRLGTAEEMAAVICFLLSDEASFITGQTLVASGGRVHLP